MHYKLNAYEKHGRMTNLDKFWMQVSTFTEHHFVIKDGILIETNKTNKKKHHA